MKLYHKNFALFQNLLVGKTFTLNKNDRISSNLGEVFLSKGTKIKLLSFDEDDYMIAEFSHYGNTGIGYFSTLNLSLEDAIPEMLFRDVKLKNTISLYSSFDEELEIPDDAIFYVSSLFEKDGEQHAFLLLIDESGNPNSTAVTISPVSNLIIVN